MLVSRRRRRGKGHCLFNEFEGFSDRQVTKKLVNSNVSSRIPYLYGGLISLIFAHRSIN